MELQFCKLPAGTAIRKLVAIDSIRNWQNDSLYADNELAFEVEYGPIFDCGTYSNLKSGTVDVYGINYYAPGVIDSLIERIRRDKPIDYEVLAAWLMKAKAYNGFYILGV